jgi:putative phosphoribosyl transferase
MKSALLDTAEIEVEIPCGKMCLPGILRSPPAPEGLVIFAHGIGSDRHSCRNGRIARELNRRKLATLLFDMQTPGEISSRDEAGPRLDIPLLSSRLTCTTKWAADRVETQSLPLGLFGAGTGAAAALEVAATLPEIRAVVTRGGRTDLARDAVDRVRAPTLLIAGSEDHAVVAWNYATYERLTCLKCLMLVGGASHLFDEPGALDQVADLAGDWFKKHLAETDNGASHSDG